MRGKFLFPASFLLAATLLLLTAISLDGDARAVAAGAGKGVSPASTSSQIIWNIKVVDTYGWFPSLALDSGNRPHMVYAYGYPSYTLYYAFYDGASWQRTIISTGGYSSLVLDQADKPHIGYCYCTSCSSPIICDDLVYTYFDGNSWITYPVDVEGYTGFNPSMALDAQGRPHIAYTLWDPSAGNLTKYAHYNGTGWNIEPVAACSYPSLALDTSGQPHIICSKDWNLIYAHSAGTEWITETVDQGYAPSLVLDSADRPHVAYTGATGLRYARHDGSGWITEEVDSTSSYYPSLTLDSDGRPHIVYHYGGPDYSLKYACRAEGHWITETVENERASWSLALKVDSLGRLHIGYTDFYTSNVRYALGVRVSHRVFLPLVLRRWP